jgi:hypothetical protein
MIFKDQKFTKQAQDYIDGFPSFIIESEAHFLSEGILEIIVKIESNF